MSAAEATHTASPPHAGEVKNEPEGISWQMPSLREIVPLALLILISLGLRYLTYHPIADGGGTRYFKVMLVGAVASLMVWALVRLQTRRGSVLPLLCAAGVLLSGDAVHYVRLANPITHGAPVRSFDAVLTSEVAIRSQWEVETSGQGSIMYEPRGVRLISPPGAPAFLRARMEPLPDFRQQWWLPVGMLEREPTDTLTWRAAVQRDGDYYVVAELQQLLIQVVPYGLHITYQDEQNRLRGHEISHPIGRDGQMREWRLSRDNQTISLSLDGQQVWSAPQRGELRQIRLGESKVESSHAGSMFLEAVTFVSRLGRS